MPGASSKSGVPIAAYPHKRFAKVNDPKNDDSFILCDPPQTTDDFQEDCLEKSPKFTVLGGLCTNSSDFDDMDLKVHSLAWAIPHFLQVAEKKFRDDMRGDLVLLKESQLSFRNVSMNEIILHANTPVARLDNPDAIYARASGFRRNGTISDDVVLKPGETLTYSVSWEKMQGYTPMTTIKEERLWMNMITFCVEMKNVSSLTGDVIPENAEVVSIIPKTRYWKRKSNPLPYDASENIEVKFQSDQNYAFQTLDGGATDLYKVEPIDAQGSAPVGAKLLDGRYVRDQVLFGARPGRTVLCQDAYNEGDLLGVAGLKLKDYSTAALKIRKRDQSQSFGFLQMPTRQGENIRLLVQGLNVSSDDRDPTFSYSYFKYVENVAPTISAWVLWDEERNEPRSADPKLGIETVVSAFIPIMVLEGLRKPKLNLEGRFSENGQPYGAPKAFSDFIKTSVSVISVISKIAGFVGKHL